MATALHLPQLVGIEVRQGDPLPIADVQGVAEPATQVCRSRSCPRSAADGRQRHPAPPRPRPRRLGTRDRPAGRPGRLLRRGPAHAGAAAAAVRVPDPVGCAAAWSRRPARRGRGPYGNHFWIGPDRRSILALGAGQSAAFVWWSTPAASRVAAPMATFAASAIRSRSTACELSGLAITDDQYLVAGVLDLPAARHHWRRPAGVRPAPVAVRRCRSPGRWSSAYARSTSRHCRTAGSSCSTSPIRSAPGPARLWHLDREPPPRRPRQHATGPSGRPGVHPRRTRPTSRSPSAASAPVSRSRRSVAEQARPSSTRDWPIAVEATGRRLGPCARPAWSRRAPRHLALALRARQEFAFGSASTSPRSASSAATSVRNTDDLLDGVAGHDLTVILHATGDERPVRRRRPR